MWASGALFMQIPNEVQSTAQEVFHCCNTWNNALMMYSDLIGPMKKILLYSSCIDYDIIIVTCVVEEVTPIHVTMFIIVVSHSIIIN